MEILIGSSAGVTINLRRLRSSNVAVGVLVIEDCVDGLAVEESASPTAFKTLMLGQLVWVGIVAHRGNFKDKLINN